MSGFHPEEDARATEPEDAEIGPEGLVDGAVVSPGVDFLVVFALTVLAAAALIVLL